jgi:hypothetical protein
LSLNKTFSEEEITRLFSGELVVKNGSNGEKIGFFAGGSFLNGTKTEKFNEQLKGEKKMAKKVNWERINELIEKALNDGGLDKAEIDELKDLLKRAEEERKQKKTEKESLSERIDMSVTFVLGKKALEQVEKRFFESLPLKEQTKALREKAEKAEKFFKSTTPKVQAEAERLKKEREERELQEFYEKYAKKFNHKL